MARDYSSSIRSTSRVFRQTFDLQQATTLGGMNELARFLRSRGIDKRLRARFGSAKSPWATWTLDRVVRVLLDASFAGIERLYHFEDLETEPLLCAQHGVDRLPDLKTLYRDLRRFEDDSLLDCLHGVMREIVVESIADQKRVVLELDSTVEVLYGEQEGAERGPNPKKPGRLSYHPLIARDRISDLVVHHCLRPGSANAATDAARFVHQALDIVRADGRRREILARMDAGFESDQILSILERRGASYVVKMRATSELASYAADFGPQAWRNLDFDGDGTIQTASFFWRRTAWKTDRRVIAIRKRDMDRLQGHLFDGMGWSYSFYVTNLTWSPGDIARFYDKRADVERTIAELKNDLSIDHVPTASFGANAADLAIKILARNLLVLYRDRGLKLTVRYRVATLRRRFIVIAGRVLRHSARTILRLSKGTPLQRALQARAAPA